MKTVLAAPISGTHRYRSADTKKMVEAILSWALPYLAEAIVTVFPNENLNPLYAIGLPKNWQQLLGNRTRLFRFGKQVLEVRLVANLSYNNTTAGGTFNPNSNPPQLSFSLISPTQLVPNPVHRLPRVFAHDVEHEIGHFLQWLELRTKSPVQYSTKQALLLPVTSPYADAREIGPYITTIVGDIEDQVRSMGYQPTVLSMTWRLHSVVNQARKGNPYNYPGIQALSVWSANSKVFQYALKEIYRKILSSYPKV